MSQSNCIKLEFSGYRLRLEKAGKYLIILITMNTLGGLIVVFSLFKIALKYLSLMPQTVTSTYQIWSLRTMKGVANYMLKAGRGRWFLLC